MKQSNIEIERLETETFDYMKRDWYLISGTEYRTGIEFGDEAYARCQDGTILDSEVSPFVDSVYQFIAVVNCIDCLTTDV